MSLEEARSNEMIWHLYWEAAVAREFFPTRELYRQLRTLIVRAVRRRGPVVVGYLLLPREIHLLLSISSDSTVGAIARVTGPVIARRVNRAARIRSPVFAGRYRAARIRTAEELRGEMRLLAWRAVITGHCRDPVTYPYSSVRVCLGLAAQNGFDSCAALRQFAGSVVEARAALRSLLANRPSNDEMHRWAASKALGCVTEPELSVACARAIKPESPDADALRAAADGTTHGAIELLETWAAMKMTISSAEILIVSTRRAAARGRGLVACLATRVGVCTAAFILKRYGLSKATLSEQMRRWREDKASRTLLNTPVSEIINEVNGTSARNERLASDFLGQTAPRVAESLF